MMKTKAELIQTGLALLVMGAAAAEMLGRPARLVEILTLIAGGIGAGISVGRWAERRRAQQEARASDHASRPETPA